jgi:hypothetical protein
MRSAVVPVPNPINAGIYSKAMMLEEGWDIYYERRFQTVS